MLLLNYPSVKRVCGLHIILVLLKVSLISFFFLENSCCLNLLVSLIYALQLLPSYSSHIKNKKMNRFHERPLWILQSDRQFHPYISIQILTTWMLKVNKSMSPPKMYKHFKPRNYQPFNPKHTLQLHDHS